MESADALPAALVRELSALNRSDHPNLIKMHKCILEEPEQRKMGTFQPIWLVLDFVPGTDLLSHIKKKGPLDERDALEMTMQVADALRYMHEELKMIHRDVKPDNIQLHNGNATTPMLIDYGLARRLPKGGDGDGSVMLTRTMSGKVGTPGFMAPEVTPDVMHVWSDAEQQWIENDARNQLWSGNFMTKDMRLEANYCANVDVWSLGACLYYSLCAKEPGWDTDDGEMELNREKGRYSKELLRRHGVSEGVIALVGSMMEVDVQRRLSAAQVVQQCKLLR